MAVPSLIASRSGPPPANAGATRDNPSTNSSATNAVPSQPVLDLGSPPSPAPYQVIAARNMFGLQPIQPPASEPPPTAAPPKDDLQLTGLVNLGPVRSAFFQVAEPGQPPTCFTLAEGDQNDWLELLLIDATQQTVKVRLKKPVIRIRSVGTEVLLTPQTRH